MTSEVRNQVAAGTSAGVLSSVGLAGIAVTVVTFTALHLLPPTRDISPIRRTISEYALTSSAWAFNLGVVTLAGSSAAVFAGLVVVGRMRALSAATLFGAVWVAGLLTLVSFPKHNWALGGPGSSGQVHRMASLFAFLALPIAVLLIARRRGGDRRSAPARWSSLLGILSLAWFSPLLIAIISSPRAWWQVIPLGAIERGMALTEVLAIVALALLVRASNPADGAASLLAEDQDGVGR